MQRQKRAWWWGAAVALGISVQAQTAAPPAAAAATEAPQAVATPAAPMVPAEAAAPAAEGPLPVPAQRPRGAPELNPERLKDLQRLQGLRRDSSAARRAILIKQHGLNQRPEVAQEIAAIDAKVRDLQDQIKTLEAGKPALYIKADESLKADYDKLNALDAQVQELERTLYPARPNLLRRPGLDGAPLFPSPPAVPTAPAAPPAPAAKP